MPPRQHSVANMSTGGARRKLRTSPSSVILEDAPSQSRTRKRLCSSPSLAVVDGPAPVQPPAKKARLDNPPSCPTTTPKSSRKKATTPKSAKARNVIPQSPNITTNLASGSSNMPGSSSTALPTPSPTQVTAVAQPSPSKRKGKGKATSTEAPVEEKRAARHKPRCPQNIMERVERVRQQRIFMIDRSRSEDELRETFSVLGSTGNVYSVVIDKLPRCNCPDSLKGNHCKHILFVFLKVLQVPESSPHWYQKALLSSELEQIFTQAPLAPNSIAHERVRDAHAQATAQYTGSSSQSVKKRYPTRDDDCPICYEKMYGVGESALKFCEACGNALHVECWNQWQNSSHRSGKSVTCVWCRAESNTEDATGRRKKKGNGNGTPYSEGYLNLASVAGCSPIIREEGEDGSTETRSMIVTIIE
ncbi:hypothetical protein AX17_004910 [Amanita inopinata Kibby_2008]|nr:hypothetical protein AX17_004910 [Amanita inopinata Kibby_2008]